MLGLQLHPRRTHVRARKTVAEGSYVGHSASARGSAGRQEPRPHPERVLGSGCIWAQERVSVGVGLCRRR